MQQPPRVFCYYFSKMKRGTDVELPLWLTQVMRIGKLVLVERAKMKGYDEKFKDDLEADAKTKSFARYPHFYTVGMTLGKL